MAGSPRYRALDQAGLLHPAAETVVAEPFRSHPQFFATFDKVQVKYEMLRAHVLDGQTASGRRRRMATRALRSIWCRRRSSDPG